MLKYKYIPPHRRATSSLQTTPEPTPRMSRPQHLILTSSQQLNSYGSETSLFRNSYIHGSTNSLASTSSSSAYTRRKKGRAPLPPAKSKLAQLTTSTAELNLPVTKSTGSSPCPSIRSSPMPRKKRLAPLPPQQQLESTPKSTSTIAEDNIPSAVFVTNQSDSLTTLESSWTENTSETAMSNTIQPISPILPIRKLIPLDASLISDSELSRTENATTNLTDSVVYRRTIVPTTLSSDDTTLSHSDHSNQTNERQWQKIKENKESKNKNRQSQLSMSSPTNSDSFDPIYSNKSQFGKWKRRKGPAPALPIPSRKSLQLVPLQEIRHELEVIEVQQQGLEKQV